MGNTETKPTEVLMEVEVPASLVDFVEEWSHHTDESKRDIVQSLFSHGLASLCAVHDWTSALVDKVAPILEDLAACSGQGTEVLYIDLHTEARFSTDTGRRHN